MSTTQAIARNTTVQIVGKAISTLLGLLAVAIMTRSLGVEQFGYYTTAVGFLQFAATLCDFGFTVNTAKLLSEPNINKQALLNNIFTWRLITAILFEGVALTILWFLPYNPIIKYAAIVLVLSFIANILNQVFTGYFQTKLQMITVMIGEILGRLILVVGVWGIGYKQLGFLPAMAVVTVAAWVYTIYLWTHSAPIKLQINRSISTLLFSKMWPTALAVIFNTFYLLGDRIVLPLYVSAAEVGFYGAAYRVLDIMAQVGFMVMGVMVPILTYHYSRALKIEFKKYYQLAFDLVLLIVLPMTIGTIVLAEPIMRLVAGNEFAGSGKILALLSISTVGVCFGMTYSMIAIAIDRQRYSTWVFALDAILSVIGYFIFIPKFGMYGAAGVTIFSEFLAGIWLFFLCVYHTKIWPSFITAAKITIAGAIMGAVVYRFQSFNLLILIILGALIYSTLIIVLRVVSVNTIKEILASRRPPQLPNA